MTLDRLPLAAGVATRQASAENPTGAPGEGARWEPDPTHPDLPYSGPSLVLGRGWKVRPYVPLPAGSELVLADVEGPGTIRHLFLTTDAPLLRPLVVRAWWDGAAEPAIVSPLGDLFALGDGGVEHSVTSAVVTVGPARACSAVWPMPFRRHARLTLTNEGATDVRIVAYRVSWEEGPVATEAAYLHARYARSSASRERPSHVLLDTVGRGAYVGTTMAWTTREPGWWGEGEVKVWLDDDHEHPSIVDNGTEDYFGGAWGFGRDHGGPDPDGQVRERAFSAPYAGCPLVTEPTEPERRFHLYRWHIPDPIGFRDRIRVEVQSLGWGPDGRYAIRADDIASVALWYQWDGGIDR